MLHNDNHFHTYSGIWWFGMVIICKPKIDGKLELFVSITIQIEFMIQIILSSSPRFCQDFKICNWVFCTNVDKRWKGENVNECWTCLDMLDKRTAVDFIFGSIYVYLCRNCFMHHAWYLDKWYEVFFLTIKSYLSPISCCFLL